MEHLYGYQVNGRDVIHNYVEQRNFTLVATGSARGGTSILSYLLVNLGFDLGPKSNKQQEDPHFFPWEWDDKRKIKNYILQRNNENNIWGFKMPHAVNELEFLSENLRNPIFICIYRSPLSVMNSIITRDNEFYPNESPFYRSYRALKFACHNYSATLKLFDINDPFILVDYEIVKEDPVSLIRLLCDVFELSIDISLIHELAQGIKSPGYK